MVYDFIFERRVYFRTDTSRLKKSRTSNRTVSLRISEPILHGLERESASKLVSLNTLANQIFLQHLKWHSLSASAGIISLPKSIVVGLIEGLDDDRIADLARTLAASDCKDLLLILRKEYSIDSFLDMLETWIAVCGFPHRSSNQEGVHKYIIQHDGGGKLSMFLSEYLKDCCEGLASKVRTETTPGTVVLNIEV